MERPKHILKETAGRIHQHIQVASNEEARIQWLEKRISSGLENGILTPPQATKLRSYLSERACQRFLFDAAVAQSLLTIPSGILDLSFAVLFLGNINVDPSVKASVAFASLWPTAIYTAVRFTSEIVTEGKKAPIKARLIGGIVSPFKIVGALSLPLQAGIRYPELGLLLTTQASDSITNKMRRFGAAGRFIADKTAQVDQWLIKKFITPGEVNPDILTNPSEAIPV